MPTEQKQKHIVIVEDEEMMAGLITSKLEKAGYTVSMAKDGKTGLELIKKEKPDLVLLDVALPQLNGFQILEALAEEKLLPALPVVIISNSGQPVEIERALQLGIRDYLVKINFSPIEVLAKVNQVFATNNNPKRPGEEKI